MVLVVDLYALRSRQFAWLLRLSQEWEATRNLSQLPNFAFSTAVAHFQLASSGQGDVAQADSALQSALIMFPGVLTRLLDKCAVQPDAAVANHSFFGPKAQTRLATCMSSLLSQ